MNLVKLNSSNKTETHKCLFEIYPNIFIFVIRAGNVINIKFIFRFLILSDAFLVRNSTRITLFTRVFLLSGNRNLKMEKKKKVVLSICKIRPVCDSSSYVSDPTLLTTFLSRYLVNRNSIFQVSFTHLEVYMFVSGIHLSFDHWYNSYMHSQIFYTCTVNTGP